MIRILGAASTTCSGSRSRSARQAGGDHRRLGLRQVDARVRVLFAEGQRRFLDCLSTYVRHSSGRWPGRRWLASRACRPRSRSSRSSRAGHRCRPLEPQARSTTTCACCGRGSASSTARSAGSPARSSTWPRSPRAWRRTSRGASSRCSRRCVRRRKGFHKYVIAAAAKQGVAEVRVDGALHPRRRRRGSTASRSTTSRRSWRASPSAPARVSSRARSRGRSGWEAERSSSSAEAWSASTRRGAPARAAAAACRLPTRASSRGARSTVPAPSATASLLRASTRTASSGAPRGSPVRPAPGRGCGPRRARCASGAATSARSRRSRSASCGLARDAGDPAPRRGARARVAELVLRLDLLDRLGSRNYESRAGRQVEP